MCQELIQNAFPGFFIAHDRGRFPLRLPKARVEGKRDEPGQDLETRNFPCRRRSQTSKSWADEASSGTHPVWAIIGLLL